jgi:hypothetical protein
VFFEHPLIPDMPASTEETYVLMPGLLYDGNRLSNPTMQLPQLTAAENYQVDTPVLTLSIPLTAFHHKQSGRTLMYLTEPTTALGMSGFSCAMRPDDYRISVMAPCYRERHFHHVSYDPEVPKGPSSSRALASVFRSLYLLRLVPISSRSSMQSIHCVSWCGSHS